MSENKTVVEKEVPTSYFRFESFSSLQVPTDQVDEIGNPVYERFTPYFETYQGDSVKVGYLATSNPRVVEVLTADINVEVIDQKDFEKATGEKAVPAPQPAS